MCGERDQQCIISAIEEKLGDCFSFEKASVLISDSDRLLSIQSARTEKGELYVGTLLCIIRE